MTYVTRTSLIFLTLSLLTACSKEPWNSPYPSRDATANVRYSSFFAPPKTLDPARSYSNDETIFIAQIYEPLLQYHYLKRPYTLVPLTAAKMPTVHYLDQQGKILPENASLGARAFTVYELAIQPGIYYQPHPAFAKNAQGQFLYHPLSSRAFRRIKTLADFQQTGRRELIAEDYVYEIKRLAAPGVNSPIYGLMTGKIVGLRAFAQSLKNSSPQGAWLDLRRYPLSGVQVIDRYHFRIVLQKTYPQFIYWLAMPFFSPIPWEVDAFYAQPGMAAANLTLDWYPVGTGPYTLIENNPNRRMVLARNPYFHAEFYPTEGAPGDREAGYLKNAGKPLPFIDRAIFTLEKETIPRWNKFLQGYYDQSTISSDSFDQAIQINRYGQATLTPQLKKMGVYLQTTSTQAITYMGFNMLDKVVGGDSERARKLRLAIAIALDYEAFINIFLNGRGESAQSPLPPNIYGHLTGKQGMNPFVYRWEHGMAVRRPLSEAKRLLGEAGYPDGMDPATQEPLILNYDVASTSGPDEKSLLAWMREQFAKIGIQLNIRNTEYNRFQQKMRQGEGQIFSWGWIADYPDPENFLFLLYGPESQALQGGENATNYSNKTYDALFDQMKNMPNGPERQGIIQKMLAIIRYDSPWLGGVYQQEFALSHTWCYPSKPNVMSYNTLKYQRLDPVLRHQLRKVWNQKNLWPLGVVALLWLLVSLPVVIRYRQKERKSVK